jgi:hypothetical protein
LDSYESGNAWEMPSSGKRKNSLGDPSTTPQAQIQYFLAILNNELELITKVPLTKTEDTIPLGNFKNHYLAIEAHFPNSKNLKNSKKSYSTSLRVKFTNSPKTDFGLYNRNGGDMSFNYNSEQNFDSESDSSDLENFPEKNSKIYPETETTNEKNTLYPFSDVETTQEKTEKNHEPIDNFLKKSEERKQAVLQKRKIDLKEVTKI